MSDPDYRAQARAVRAAARQRLRELSQRRGAEVPRWQAAAQAVAAPPPPEPDLHVEAVAPQPVASEQAAAMPPAPLAEPVTAAFDTDLDTDAEADGHDLSVMTVSMAASAVAQRASHEPPSRQTAAPAQASASKPSSVVPAAPSPHIDPAQSDLRLLPGVGPGLVWLLAEAGVPDCAALSRADSADLAAKLGLVGRLVDIGGLQALAAERAPSR